MEKKEGLFEKKTNEVMWVTYIDKDGNIRSAPSNVFKKFPKDHFFNKKTKSLRQISDFIKVKKSGKEIFSTFKELYLK